MITFSVSAQRISCIGGKIKARDVADQENSGGKDLQAKFSALSAAWPPTPNPVLHDGCANQVLALPVLPRHSMPESAKTKLSSDIPSKNTRRDTLATASSALPGLSPHGRKQIAGQASLQRPRHASSEQQTPKRTHQTRSNTMYTTASRLVA